MRPSAQSRRAHRVFRKAVRPGRRRRHACRSDLRIHPLGNDQGSSRSPSPLPQCLDFFKAYRECKAKWVSPGRGRAGGDATWRCAETPVCCGVASSNSGEGIGDRAMSRRRRVGASRSASRRVVTPCIPSFLPVTCSPALIWPVIRLRAAAHSKGHDASPQPILYGYNLSSPSLPSPPNPAQQTSESPRTPPRRLADAH